MGMSTEFAGKVFESYSRERTAEKIEGTGLGMGITKSIVDLMGGTILVESRQGVGTEFVISLSFAPALNELKTEEGNIAKPFDTKKMLDTLGEILR